MLKGTELHKSFKAGADNIVVYILNQRLTPVVHLMAQLQTYILKEKAEALGKFIKWQQMVKKWT